ncbi:MAG: AraC family transcriptional regulator [Pseudomonadales bacterium]|nr:AraC family transcriptional regulator [Pseudomonadales bacterium]
MKAYIGKEYLNLYVDYLKLCGANLERSYWLSKHKAELTSSEDFVSFQVVRELKHEFSTITNQLMFPFEFGYHLGDNISTHLDFSLKSCANVQEIAELSTQFHFIRSNVLTPKFGVADGYLEFEIFNEFNDNEFWLPMLFATAALTFRFLSNLYGDGCEEYFVLYVDSPEPEYFQSIQERIPFPIKFSTLRNCLAIDATLLTMPNPGHDPRLKALLMKNVEEKSQRLRPVQFYRYRIREVLLASAPNYLCAEEAAEKLHISKRTLARRLKDENTTFLNILNEIRIEEAERCLGQGLSVGETAEQLGYESCASFINLFKKHVGITPTEYRKSS